MNKEIIGLRIQKIISEEERAESKKLVDYLSRDRGPRTNYGLSRSKKKIESGHQEGKYYESKAEAIKRFSKKAAQDKKIMQRVVKKSLTKMQCMQMNRKIRKQG